ncbi:hypothetical protein [Phenylobacterium sp.]|uniref:hypothetical protein n=1 Tax=Phenylobacterium sp. TaxID=1871053 RepID=UPI0027361133|nr:hypothetical protein [Phenylobacterium sp.]MDP3661167.1 hypothetical protein [Phenylobacterium sp.]
MSLASLQLPHWLWWVAICGVCANAGWRGGPSERIGAAAIFVGWMIAVLLPDDQWLHLRWTTTVVDILVFAVLIWLALRSDRYWPICAAAFQLLAVVTHVAQMLDRTLGNWVYYSAGVLWGYLLLVPLAVGTWTYRAARRRAEVELAMGFDPAIGDTRR